MKPWWTTPQGIRERRAVIEADMARIPSKQHAADKQSARFKLVGGPHHDRIVRLYAPFSALRYKDGTTYELQELMPDTWVYVHTTEWTEDD
jgi:hypothetical protein